MYLPEGGVRQRRMFGAFQTFVGGIANRNHQEDNLRHSHIEYPNKHRNDDNLINAKNPDLDNNDQDDGNG